MHCKVCIFLPLSEDVRYMYAQFSPEMAGKTLNKGSWYLSLQDIPLEVGSFWCPFTWEKKGNQFFVSQKLACTLKTISSPLYRCRDCQNQWLGKLRVWIYHCEIFYLSQFLASAYMRKSSKISFLQTRTIACVCDSACRPLCLNHQVRPACHDDPVVFK